MKLNFNFMSVVFYPCLYAVTAGFSIYHNVVVNAEIDAGTKLSSEALNGEKMHEDVVSGFGAVNYDASSPSTNQDNFGVCVACDGQLPDPQAFIEGATCDTWNRITMAEANGSDNCYIQRLLGVHYCGCPSQDKPPCSCPEGTTLKSTANYMFYNSFLTCAQASNIPAIDDANSCSVFANSCCDNGSQEGETPDANVGVDGAGQASDTARQTSTADESEEVEDSASSSHHRKLSLLPLIAAFPIFILAYFA